MDRAQENGTETTNVAVVGGNASIKDSNINNPTVIGSVHNHYHNKASKSITQETFTNHLRSYYKKKCSHIDLLLGGRSWPIKHLYIPLAIEETLKDQLPHQANHAGAFLGAKEMLFVSKKRIALEALYQEAPLKKNSNCSQVLIVGRAGVGKSTLCRYITYRWSQCELWEKRYSLVVWISLRNLNTRLYTSQTTLAEFIQQSIRSDESWSLEKLLKDPSTQQSTLFLLDGYDELPSEACDEGHGLALVFQALCEMPHVIITSRPLDVYPHLNVQVTLEMVGFDLPYVKKYIQRFFANTESNTWVKPAPDFSKPTPSNSLQSSQAQAAWDFVRKQPILGISQIPINLELICSLWQSESLETQEKKWTVSMLYHRLVMWLMKRAALRMSDLSGKTSSTKRSLIQKGDPEADNIQLSVLLALSELAWKATENNTHYISSSQIQTTWNDCRSTLALSPYEYDTILEVGILKPVSKDDEQYCFIHSSFQEYFAGYYLARKLHSQCVTKAPLKGIWKKLDNLEPDLRLEPRYSLVWWFTAGELARRVNSEDERSQSGLSFYFDWLVRPTGLSSFFERDCQLGLQIRCLEEASLPNWLKQRQAIIEKIQYFLHKGWWRYLNNDSPSQFFLQLQLSPQVLRVSDANKLLLQHLPKTRKALVMMAKSKFLSSDQCLLLLKSFYTNLSHDMLRALTEISTSNSDSVLLIVLSALKKALANEKSYLVTHSTIWSHSEMTVEVHSPGLLLLTVIEEALADKNQDVRMRAASAYGLFSSICHLPDLTWPTVLTILENALTDKDRDVCFSAAGAFGLLAGNKYFLGLALSRMLTTLDKALANRESVVRISATRAYCWLIASAYFPQSAWPGVLTALEKALADKEIDVRKSAVEEAYSWMIVSSHSTEFACPRVLTALEKALADNESSVSYRAFIAYEKVVTSAHFPKSSWPRVLSTLDNILTNNDHRLFKEAVRIYGRVATRADFPESAWPRVLTALEKAVLDPNSVGMFGGIDYDVSSAWKDVVGSAHFPASARLRLLTFLEKAWNDDSMFIIHIPYFYGMVVNSVYFPESDWPAVLAVLDNALTDNRLFVQETIVEIYGEVAACAHFPKFGWPAVLSAIDRFLVDDAGHVRKGVFRIYGKIATYAHFPESAWPNVFTALEKALAENDEDMRDTAARLYGTVATSIHFPESGWTTVLSALDKAMAENYGAFVGAAWACCEIVEKAHLPESVWPALLTALEKCLSINQQGTSSFAFSAYRKMARNAIFLSRFWPKLLVSLEKTLHSQRKYMRKGVVSVYEELATGTHFSNTAWVALLTSVEKALVDENSDVRESAIEAYSKIVVSNHFLESAWSRVLKVLERALADNESDVRISAIKAYCKIAVSTRLPELAWPAILAALEKALHDEKSYVQFGVVEAFDWITENSYFTESSWLRVLTFLEKVIASDEASGARKSAVMVYGRVAGSDQFPESAYLRVLTILDKTLADKDWTVRRRAARAYGRAAKSSNFPKSAFPRVLASLEKALSDEKIHVRENALGSYPDLVKNAHFPKSAFSRVLAALEKAFSDEKSHVRLHAYCSFRDVVKNGLENANFPESDFPKVDQLVNNFLVHEEDSLRERVTKIWRSEFTYYLTEGDSLFAEEESYVREIQVEKVGRNAAGFFYYRESEMPAVISFLDKALLHKDSSVRHEAARAKQRIMKNKPDDPKHSIELPTIKYRETFGLTFSNLPR